jgi:hypothetical protein
MQACVQYSSRTESGIERTPLVDGADPAPRIGVPLCVIDQCWDLTGHLRLLAACKGAVRIHQSQSRSSSGSLKSADNNRLKCIDLLSASFFRKRPDAFAAPKKCSRMNDLTDRLARECHIKGPERVNDPGLSRRKTDVRGISPSRQNHRPPRFARLSW